MTKAYILNFLREHEKELYDRFGIKKIALFGSYAKDEAREDSDIDLAIVEIDKKDYFNRVQAKYFLEELLQKSVDIGYLSSMRNFLRKRVEKEMIYV
ncbi:MAG: nucleotidyltransferase family protein [Sulfurimonas sp.]|uniref:nucleotidyltransferase family protein n=1 Tax=Sulfurimonas sp. TaxID=2022749 RepID=UPI00262A7BFF|nr:nucleotidyltransferase family protein [Sulfurimonas sp.]MDD2651821.1 nucleotidyltransferase family protein [Sulfurimonas sp.]MDD3451627.1 nucleotidyltransferase family protein [Sulfurimonas sp.]